MSNTTLPALPSDLPPIGKARLPATYEGAKVALAECTRLDECQDWADKAEALASYAKQAQDDELRKMADRIQARAIRRCGELLQQIASARGANQNIREGTLPKVPTRTDAANDAGLSEHQRKTAIRVSRIPDREFEEAVEGDEPATVTTLAERGTQQKAASKLDQVRSLRERQFEPQDTASTPSPSDSGRIQNAILNSYLALKGADNADAQAARRGLNADQIAQALEYIDSCFGRLRKLQAALRGDQ